MPKVTKVERVQSGCEIVASKVCCCLFWVSSIKGVRKKEKINKKSNHLKSICDFIKLKCNKKSVFVGENVLICKIIIGSGSGVPLSCSNR